MVFLMSASRDIIRVMKRTTAVFVLSLVCLLFVTTDAAPLTIEPVIGVYTFQELAPEGFRNGFIEFKKDHTYTLVIHLDRDGDRIADDVDVRKGEYRVSRKPDGAPGVLLSGDEEVFLEHVRVRDGRYWTFCCFGVCFERKGEKDPLFPDDTNRRNMSGPISIETDPPGASVKLDGKLLPGATPMTIPGVVAGIPHSLRIEHIERNPYVLTLQAGAGQSRRLQIDLPSEDAWIRVRSIPWTNVYIDGEFSGRTPTEKLKVYAGSHTVLLLNEGSGISKEISVDLKEGETWEKLFKFFGRLSLRIDPPVEVYIRDVHLGLTPIENRKVPVGIQRVRLVNPETGDEKTINVRIELDRLQVVEGSLETLE